MQNLRDLVVQGVDPDVALAKFGLMQLQQRKTPGPFVVGARPDQDRIPWAELRPSYRAWLTRELAERFPDGTKPPPVVHYCAVACLDLPILYLDASVYLNIAKARGFSPFLMPDQGL